MSEILNIIRDFLQNHPQSPVIIGGDLNIDFNKSNNSFKFLQEAGFTNIMNITSAPTHESGSHIDHVWVRHLHASTVTQMWTYYSDHKQIFVDFHN